MILTVNMLLNFYPGSSLAMQWLELGALTARARVQSMVRELRSCNLCGMAKQKQKAIINFYPMMSLRQSFKLCICR